MASKKEMFTQVMDVLSNYELPSELVSALEGILKPKQGGGKTINLDEVVKRDEEGNIIAILDSISGLWLPATEEVFYLDKSGKGIEVGDVHLKRVSKEGYGISSKHKKSIAASKEAIFNDVLEGVLTPEEGKQRVEELTSSEPDFSEMEDMAVA